MIYAKTCPSCGEDCIGGWCPRCRESFPGSVFRRKYIACWRCQQLGSGLTNSSATLCEVCDEDVRLSGDL